MNALYYFLDSSAVVKHYVAEKGSTWVDALVHPDAGNMIAIAQITVAEAAAALGSKLRAKAISSSEFELAVKNMLRDTFEAFNVVELNQPIIQRAVDAIRRHPLRGYDAVQLACALALNDALAAAGEEPLIFVTADKILLASAKAEGLQIEDPNSHETDQ